MNIEAKFKTDVKFRKRVITIAAEKLGCTVEMIDLRSGVARLSRNGQTILVSLWRGIGFENAVKQVASAVRNA